MKRINLTISQTIIAACMVMAVSAGAIAGAQWRFDLVDRVEARVVRYFSPQPTATIPFPTPTPTLQPDPPLIPNAFQEQGIVFNSLVGNSSNPVVQDLTLNPKEDLVYLQLILNTIFPNGTTGLTDEQISIRILQYVSSYLLLESNTGTATKILQEGHAICGGMSISFRALIQLAGIPARYVGIFGLPKLGSHAIAEVYYDGQWHLYDPTYGLIFYSEPVFNGRGRIPSLAELRAGTEKNLFLFKVVETPWKGKYDHTLAQEFKITQVEKDYLSDYYGFDFVKLYKELFFIAFPLASQNLQILSFPVQIDFVQNSIISTGIINSDGNDVIQATSNDQKAGLVGSRLIGGDGIEQVQTWFIKAQSPGYFRVTYHSINDESPSLLLFPLKSIYVVSSSQEEGTAEFLLHMNDTNAAMQFWAEDGIFQIDQWQAEWLGQSFDTTQ